MKPAQVRQRDAGAAAWGPLLGFALMALAMLVAAVPLALLLALGAPAAHAQGMTAPPGPNGQPARTATAGATRVRPERPGCRRS